MSLYIHIAGPDTVGAPVVRIGVGGKYGPDILDDLKRRAVDAYRELFDELLEPIDTDDLDIDVSIDVSIDDTRNLLDALDPDAEAGQ